MMRPKLLILAEPTLGLAPVVIEQLSNALHELRRTSAITLLLGEQNVKFALPHADRIYVLERGEVMFSGTLAQAYRDRDVMRVIAGQIEVAS